MPDKKTQTDEQEAGATKVVDKKKDAPAVASSPKADEAGDERGAPVSNPEKKKEKGGRLPPVVVAEGSADLSKVAKSTLKKAEGKLILVPVDFSDHSEAALLLASELADMMQATLVILHVVHDPGEMPGYYAKLVKKKRVARIQDIAGEVFDDFMKRVMQEHPHRKPLHKAHSLMVLGLPVTRILQVVEKFKPVMVVMGSQGRTGLKHLLLGSKAEQVVQLCPVPVTIVKTKK